MSQAELRASDLAACEGQYERQFDVTDHLGVEFCVEARERQRWDRTNALLDMGSSINSSMPVYHPVYSPPIALPAPSVYVAPTPNWSDTTNYMPHVQPAPQYVPVSPGPATGAGGWGLNPQ